MRWLSEQKRCPSCGGFIRNPQTIFCEEWICRRCFQRFAPVARKRLLQVMKETAQLIRFRNDGTGRTMQ